MEFGACNCMLCNADICDDPSAPRGDAVTWMCFTIRIYFAIASIFALRRLSQQKESLLEDF